MYRIFAGPRIRVVLSLTLLFGLGGCSAIREKRAASKCRAEHSAAGSPLLALIGTEGVSDICDCTMAKVFKRLPDADRQVAAWRSQMAERAEKRGLLGVLGDSSFVSARSSEVATFAAVYGTAWSECAADAMSRNPSPR